MADPPNTLQPINPEALDRLTAEERGRRRGELAEAHFASVIRRIVARTNGVLIPSLVEGAQREISPELTRIFTQRQAELAEERRKQQIEKEKETVAKLLQSAAESAKRVSLAVDKFLNERRLEAMSRGRAQASVGARLAREQREIQQSYPVPELSGNKLKKIQNQKAKSNDKDILKYQAATAKQKQLLEACEAQRGALTEKLVRELMSFASIAPPFINARTMLELWDLARENMQLSVALARLLPVQESVECLVLARMICESNGDKIRLCDQCFALLDRGVRDAIVLPVAQCCLDLNYPAAKLWLIEFAAHAKDERALNAVSHCIELMLRNRKHIALLTDLLSKFGWTSDILDLEANGLFPCTNGLRWLCGLDTADPLLKLALQTMLRLAHPRWADDLPALAAACAANPQLRAEDVFALVHHYPPAHLEEVIRYAQSLPTAFNLTDVTGIVSLTHPGTVQADWTGHLQILALQAQLAADRQTLKAAVDLLACSSAAKVVLKKAIDQFTLAGGSDLGVEGNIEHALIAEVTSYWAPLQHTPGLRLVTALWVPGGAGGPDRKDRNTHWEWTKNLMADVNNKEHNIHLHPPHWRVPK